jgi:hypothetical protein
VVGWKRSGIEKVWIPQAQGSNIYNNYGADSIRSVLIGLDTFVSPGCTFFVVQSIADFFDHVLHGFSENSILRHRASPWNAKRRTPLLPKGKGVNIPLVGRG